MNMEIADKQNMELAALDVNALTDAELDEANGGLIWFIAAGAYLVGVGAVAGYYTTKAIINRCSCN
jgi:hypothetical protein